MASVIKASGAARSTESGAFNFEDLGTKAQSYLEQMRAQAGQMLMQAQRDAAAIRERALLEGKQAALQAAEALVDEKVGKQMTTLLPALKQAVDGIAQVRQAWLAHSEKTTVHVAAAIAARIIRRELSRAPDITLVLVKEALEMAAGGTEIQIRLHPDDHAAPRGERCAARVPHQSEDGAKDGHDVDRQRTPCVVCLAQSYWSLQLLR